MNKHFIVFITFILLGIFFLSTIWEFLIEGWAQSWMVTDHDTETNADKWKVVCTTTIFSAIALSLYVLLTFRNIKQKKVVEVALQESEERFQLAMAATTDGLWDWNIATGDVYYSPRWMTMLGYEPNELQHRFETWETIIHPDDIEQALKNVNDYVNGDIPKYEIEHRLRSKDGDWKWILARGKIFERDVSGKPLRMTGTHIDITEKKMIEEKFKESEERYRTIFKQMSSIVSGTSPATSGELFFQSLVLHLASALQIDYAFIAEYIPEREKMFKTLAFCVKGNIIDNIVYDVTGTPCELVYGGQTKIFPEKVQEQFPNDPYLKQWGIESYIGFPLIREQGKATGVLGVMHGKPVSDTATITSILTIFASRAGAEIKRMRAEKNLSDNARKLERANTELQSFAHIASHDLQEPLRKIIIFGDRLESTIQSSNEKGKGYLDGMQKSATRMKSFIEDLLHYTRVEMKAQPFESVDLKEISENIINELEYRLQETKGIVNINNLPVLEADPFQMGQLFLNLIGNGLKFHREGVPPIINLDSICKENGMWEISVEDNGIGIDEQYVDRIFKPFERLHNRSTYEGTGIGLTICNKIVTRHGGKISVKKLSENGVTFLITLPGKQKEKDVG